jgi:hypothetical protein
VIQFFNFPHEVADQFARSPFKAAFIKRLKKNHTYPFNKISKPTTY